MILFHTGRVALIIAVLASAIDQGSASPTTANEIIREAVKRASSVRANTANIGYTYTKVNVTEELDGKGKVKQQKRRVFQVHFRSGETFVKLVEVDGHRPAEADLKVQAETQSSTHQLFGKSGSGEDGHGSLLTPEIVARFDFTLVGQTSINGRPAYQINFAPKESALPVRRMIDRLLDRISGTLWIDSDEYEVARADLSLGSEVDFLGGVLGCLRKIAYTMTRVRVADGIWLHSASFGDFEGRKLLESMWIKTKSECRDFRLVEATRSSD
jgi:hypothetical protein